MNPVELRRLQTIHSSVRLLRAAQAAAQMAIEDLEQIAGIESEDTRQEVAEILRQLQALVARAPGYRDPKSSRADSTIG